MNRKLLVTGSFEVKKRQGGAKKRPDSAGDGKTPNREGAGDG